jgi:hypothetical protein
MGELQRDGAPEQDNAPSMFIITPGSPGLKEPVRGILENDNNQT